MGFVVRGLEIVRWRFAPVIAFAVILCLLLDMVPVDVTPDPMVQYSISLDPTVA